MATAIAVLPGDHLADPGLTLAGQAANAAAAHSAFTRYQSKRAENTLRTQRAGLGVFASYLAAVGVTADGAALAAEPGAWRGVTWGLVDGFVAWMIGAGYSVAAINQRLSIVKTYARLAAKAGALSAAEWTMIRAVDGYTVGEGRRMDDRRAQTRRSTKKAAAVALTAEQVRALKAQPDSTPQGRRDRVLICLLADHGLRVGEVARLRVEDVDLAAGRLTFWRPKVGLTQTHDLTIDTRQALRRYMANDAPGSGPLLRASAGPGRLTHAGVSDRNLSQRVRVLGARIGVERLSAHDLRHYWATQAARKGTPIDRLQQAGGWASPAMPLRYIEAAAIANEGVLL